MLKRNDKFYRLDKNGRSSTVSLDQLKPAYLDELCDPTSSSPRPSQPTPLATTTTPTPRARTTRPGHQVNWPDCLTFNRCCVGTVHCGSLGGGGGVFVVVLHGLCVVSLIMFLVFSVTQHCVHDLCSWYVLSCVVYKSLISRGSRRETQRNQVTLVVSSSLQSIAIQVECRYLVVQKYIHTTRASYIGSRPALST